MYCVYQFCQMSITFYNKFARRSFVLSVLFKRIELELRTHSISFKDRKMSKRQQLALLRLYE